MARSVFPGFPGVTVERDVPAEMRDGVTLYADVYRPDTTEPLPVLLQRLPYDKRTGAATFGNVHPAWYAARGYVVAMQDCRGRYSSEGEFYPFAHEMDDGHDTVEWAATLPGGDGRVGMYGFSYDGATQLLAAVTRPPSLAAIAPGFTASQYYDGWTYDGGAFALAFAAYWANLLALDTARRAGDAAALATLGASLGAAASWFWALPVDGYPPLQGGYAPYFYDWMEHSSYDDYWRRWSIDEDYSRIQVPALHVGGWYDVFLTGTVRNFTGLRSEAGDDGARRRQKLLVGPWSHMPWAPFGGSEGVAPGTRVIDDWHLRWFDAVLKGEDTGVLDHPVTVHTLDGGWRHFDDWPPPDAEEMVLYAHSLGRANSKHGDGTLSREAPGDEAPDVFVYDPSVPIPSLGGHSCCFEAITPMGPADQHTAEISMMMLVYTSQPLPGDIEIAGNVTVTLFAASDAPDTDFTARLCVVDESGRSVNLQEGIVRARFRDSLSDPSPIEPGEVYEYTIDLGPVGALVRAGSRLRLDLSSSDFPQWDRNLNTGGKPMSDGPGDSRPATQVVFHDRSRPTRVVIPVLG